MNNKHVDECHAHRQSARFEVGRYFRHIAGRNAYVSIPSGSFLAMHDGANRKHARANKKKKPQEKNAQRIRHKRPTKRRKTSHAFIIHMLTHRKAGAHQSQ